ncbi:hypothetical protein HOC80_03890 [archaeon]|nr:hypothetical protein [archaeon]
MNVKRWLAIFVLVLLVSMPFAVADDISDEELEAVAGENLDWEDEEEQRALQNFEEDDTGDTIPIFVRSYEPTILTSNLLADNDVRVYAFLSGLTAGTLVNTLTGYEDGTEPLYGGIEVEKVKVKPADIQTKDAVRGEPKYVKPLEQDLDTLGYLVITLKQQENEIEMPDEVNLTFSAEIHFTEAQRLFTLAQTYLVLPEDEDVDEWEDKLQSEGSRYTFFGGRGIIRAKEIMDNQVDLTIYSNKDLFWPIIGAPRAIADLTLNVGETSNYFDLGDLEEVALTNSKFRVRLDSLKDPAKERAVASVMVDGDSYQMVLNEDMSLFPGSTWTVSNLYEQRGSGGTEYVLEIRDKKGNKKTITTVMGMSGESTDLNRQFYSSARSGDSIIYTDKTIDSVPVNELDSVFNQYGVRVDVTNVANALDSTNRFNMVDGYTVKEVLVSILPVGYFYSIDGETIVIEEYGSGDPCNDIGFYYLDELPTVFDESAQLDDNVLNQLICSAIAEYKVLVEDFSDEETLEGVSYLDLGEVKLGELYELLASNFDSANDKMVANEKALHYYTRVDNRGQYVGDSDINAKVVELMNTMSGDFSYGEVTIDDSARQVQVKLLRIEHASDEELTSAVISDNGISETYYEGDYLFTSAVYDNGENVNWLISSIKDDYVYFTKEVLEDAQGYSSSKSKDSVAEGGTATLSSHQIQIKDIDVKKEVHLTIIPGSGETLKSKTNFSIHIPIEQRAFELNPEQIDEKLEKFKSLKEKLEKTVDFLDKLVTNWNKVCYAVFAFVTLKSSFGSTSAQARGDAISGPDGASGWQSYCHERSSGDYSTREYNTYDECMLDHSSDIENDMDAYGQARDDADAGIYGNWESDLSGKFNGSLEDCEEYVGAGVFMSDATKQEYQAFYGAQNRLSAEMQPGNEQYLNDLTTGYGGNNLDQRTTACIAASEALENADGLDEDARENMFNGIYEQHVSGGELDVDVAGYPILNDIVTFEKKCESESATIRSAGKIFTGSSTRDRIVYTDSGSSVEVSVMSTIDLKTYLTEWKATYTKTSAGSCEGYDGIITTIDTQLAAFDSAVLQSASVVSQELATRSGQKLYITSTKEVIFMGEEAFNSGELRQTWADDATIEIWGTGEFSGMPYCLPHEDGNFVKIEEYSKTNEASRFSVWNVGADGKLCTTDDVQVHHETEISLSTTMYNEYVSHIHQFVRTEFNENTRVTIDNHDFPVSSGKSSGVQTGSVAGCYEVMNPSDCKLLFTVCDPVMCPPSRFNLGGRWYVDDVVQSGFVGSVVLPQGSGDPVPICLTGVLASLKFWESQVDGMVQCLETAKFDGEYVGICDSIYSLYMCELFTREIVAIFQGSGGILDFLGGKMFGAGDQAGGGEFFQFKENMENVKSSFTYFTTEYSNQAFAAFRGRSMQEVGTEICKQAIYAKTPWFGDFIDQIATPEDPTQFTGHMTVKPYSETLGQSAYQVFYHIYAGDNANIDRVVYSVYLRNSLTGQTYGLTSECGGTSGTIEKAGMADETMDCVTQSGFDELCITINGQEQCGFGMVSTSFALDYMKDSLVAGEVLKNISSAEQCYPDAATMSPALNDVSNANVGGASLLPYEFGALSTGVQRVCSVDNPGKGQGISGDWGMIGTCDYDDVGRFLGYCWLNSGSFSIRDAEKNEIVADELAETNWDLSKQALGLDSYLADEESSSEFTRLLAEHKDEEKRNCKNVVDLIQKWGVFIEDTMSFEYAAAGQYSLAEAVSFVPGACEVKGRGDIEYTGLKISQGQSDEEDVTNDLLFVVDVGDEFRFEFTNLLANDKAYIGGRECEEDSGKVICGYTAGSRDDEVELLVLDRYDSELLKRTLSFSTEELEEQIVFDCESCGDGWVSFCGVDSCHDVGSTCYYVEKKYSVDDYCYSCKDADECTDLSDDQEGCESEICTSQFGKVCSYSGGVCSEVGDSSGSNDASASSYTANQKLIVQKICEVADELGLDAEGKKLALKVAQQESSFKHCDDSGIDCDSQSEVYGSSTNDYGVMQLNLGSHGDWFNSGGAILTEASTNGKSCSSGDNAYDMECNIILGIGHLVYRKDQYEDGNEYCCYSGQSGNKKTYTGWDAGLRGYNGWPSCDRSVACSGDPNYVENVNAQDVDELYNSYCGGSEGVFNVVVVDIDSVECTGDGCMLTSEAYEKLLVAEEEFEDVGYNINVISAYRSYDDQLYFWDLYQSGNGNIACDPGTDGSGCPHVQGGAVDIQYYDSDGELHSMDSSNELTNIMYEVGWVRYSREAWHFEYGTTMWEGFKEDCESGGLENDDDVRILGSSREGICSAVVSS